MTLNRRVSWAQFSTMRVVALDCGSASSLPAQRMDDEGVADGVGLTEERTPNPQLFEVDAHPYGRSMKEWAYNWMRWEYSIPAATNPIIVPGADYDQKLLSRGQHVLTTHIENKDGNVFDRTRTITVE